MMASARPLQTSATRAVQLVLIRPEGFPHIESFREVIDALQQQCKSLGIVFRLSINRIAGGALPVVLGSHHLTPRAWETLPTDAIIYNLEPLIEGYPWFSEDYLTLLDRHRVWDYSAENVALLQARGHRNASHLPVAYPPELAGIPKIVEDIDVLFYGILSNRRRALLEFFSGSGLRLAILNGTFGVERDAWIARSKVVLNIHNADCCRAETPRLCHLLANGRAVVSEETPLHDVDLELAAAIRFAAPKRLTEACRHLTDDAKLRSRMADQGRQLMAHRNVFCMELLGKLLHECSAAQ
ncbi:MAG: hypothetical protein Q8O25_02985 [Sulfurisoma sp.]|nr:hypothetical protein [Sulfurisoma sp.]